MTLLLGWIAALVIGLEIWSALPFKQEGPKDD